jgi:hypothetical protein
MCHKKLKGLFGWAVTLEKVVVGCDFPKSSCGTWVVAFGKRSLAFGKRLFGSIVVAFGITSPTYKCPHMPCTHRIFFFLLTELVVHAHGRSLRPAASARGGSRVGGPPAFGGAAPRDAAPKSPSSIPVVHWRVADTGSPGQQLAMPSCHQHGLERAVVASIWGRRSSSGSSSDRTWPATGFGACLSSTRPETICPGG